MADRKEIVRIGIIISFSDKIELAIKGNPIMVLCKDTVRNGRHTVLDFLFPQ